MKEVQNKRAIVVGIFIFFGIAILMAGILVLGGQRKTFEKTITLNAIFNDVGGLQKGNNIWFSGLKVGTVKRLKLLSQTQVEVEMRIEKHAEDFIRKDSKAKIGSDGLIGNRIVIVYGGSPNVPPVKAGDTLQTEVPINSAQMMNTLQESNKNLSAITTDWPSPGVQRILPVQFSILILGTVRAATFRNAFWSCGCRHCRPWH